MGWKWLLAAGVTLRVILLVYGEWQDANLPVKYTDVDYTVYTDAARAVAAGGSPFERETYRYTPVLAFLMLPNVLVHPSTGKVLFSLGDLAVALLLARIMRFQGVSQERRVWCTAAWLLNPFSWTVSSRGNADVIVVLLVLACLDCFMRKRSILAAVLFGAAVHFKIYPVIYAFAFLRCLSLVEFVRFACVSGVTFLLLTGACYVMYGYDFLFEAYLYHLVRRDHRHNFSLLFYQTYLHSVRSSVFSSPNAMLTALRGIQTLIQPVTVAVLGLCLGRSAASLPLALFAQTVAFVALNKVITAQYFTWFMAILPLVISASRYSYRVWCLLGIIWLGSEFHWLAWAYQLEFVGDSVFSGILLAALVFLGANTALLVVAIRGHDRTFSAERAMHASGLAASHSQQPMAKL